VSAPTAADRPTRLGPAVRRLLGLLAEERLRMAAVLVLTVAAVGLTVAGPVLVGRAVDTIFAGVVGSGLPAGAPPEAVAEQLRTRGQDELATMLERMGVVPGAGIDFHALGGLLLLVVGVSAASALAELLQGWLLTDAANAAARRLRTRVEEKVHRLPVAYLDRVPRGELLSTVTNDVDNVARTLSQTMSQLLVSLLTAVGVVVMMLTISPLLTLVALVVVPVATLLGRVLMRRSQRLFVQQWAHTGELNAQVEEAFTGHELVAAYGRREEVAARFAATNDRLKEVGHRAQFLSGLMNPIMVLVGNVSYVVICVVGALRVLSGGMTLGGVVAFVQYSQQLTAPLSQVASMANLVQSGVASAERVFDLLDLPEEEPDRDGALPARRQGRVAFESVSFDYGAGPLLEEVDLVAEPGQTVAVVGPTGAGKTTLVNLLTRFYDPRTGRVTLDGVDVASVPRAALRSRLGLVLQDTWLFHGTIRDNIAFGRPGATDADVRRAAEATFVDHVVRALPDGYDTVVDEEADNLSAGERQLVTIARAFVADPDVLVLDEATSAVDTRTELLVQRAMRALRAGRTSFVIAHRLSTIRHADLIVVMEAGRIVEQGSHAELLAAGGAYHRLHQAQLRARADEPAAQEAAPEPARVGV